MKTTKTTLCIKLPDHIRSSFKAAAKNQDSTMQDVVEAFITSYIESPGSFQVCKTSSITIERDDPNGRTE